MTDVVEKELAWARAEAERIRAIGHQEALKIKQSRLVQELEAVEAELEALAKKLVGKATPEPAPAEPEQPAAKASAKK